MGKFKQSLITTAGKSILLGGEVTYTTAKLFSQDVSSMTDDQVRALTALTGQLMSVGVSVEVMDNSTVSVKAVFSNKGLTADLTFSSVGWFAKAGSGTETLIAVTPIEGTKLLCAGLPNSSTDAINIAMNMAIGDSTTVNVVIDPAGTVSPVDLGSAISKIQTDVDTKATKADVDKEITTLTADKANSTDITNLQNQVDSKTSGTVVTAYDVASKSPTTKTTSYTSEELVDQGALDQFADQINQLKGRQTVDSADCNTLTDSGIYHISNPDKGKNFPPTVSWGTLIVFNGTNGTDTRIMQIYATDEGANPHMRTYGWNNNANTWSSWNQIAWTSDITNLQNTIQADKTANKTDVTNLQNTVNSKVNVDGDLFSSPGSINSWADVQADGTKNVLRSVRTEGQATDFDTGNWDAGILFGGNDTKALISVGYSGNQARVTGGNNTAVWHEDIAWKSDIAKLQNAVNSIDSTRTPIVAGAASGDDLFSFKTNQIRLYGGNGTAGKACKNLPPASNTQWFTVQYVFESPNEDGIAIYRTPSNEIWTAGCNSGTFNTGWTRVANATDITNLQSMITGLSTKVDSLQQNSLKIVPITQADYDALSTKDPNTIYAIGG